MKHIKRILELYYAAKLSKRGIARHLGLGRSSVGRVIERVELARIPWPLPAEVTDADLEVIVYPNTGQVAASERPVPDWEALHSCLATDRSMTLSEAWRAYIDAHPTGYQYSRFCDLYRAWRSVEVDTVMRQRHKAGDQVFVDYSGKRPSVIDSSTGEARPVELFVAALGASNYTYAEATWTQQTADFCGSIRRTFEFFGRTPRTVVCDNLRAAVTKFQADDVPLLNPSFRDLLDHYNVNASPARPRKPRDKAKVEKAVQHVQCRVMQAVRNRQFFDLDELNATIADVVQAINAAPLQKLQGSRQSRFDEMDYPLMLPLPPQPYEYGEWTGKRKVSRDYHVLIKKHLYSVPYRYVFQSVRGLVHERTVEIFHGDERIAVHTRGSAPGEHTTLVAHMPKNHRERATWSPERFIRRAKSHGPHTAALIEAIVEHVDLPEHCYRPCRAILDMGPAYGSEALERACEQALAQQTLSAGAVRELIKANGTAEPPRPIDHENIRGADYYSSNSSS